MPRIIRVNTEDLWDAALRYERLIFGIEDIAAGLDTVRSDLGEVSSSGDLLQIADSMSRRTGDLIYRTHELCAKLRFAASRYEDYDKRIKTGMEDDED